MTFIGPICGIVGLLYKFVGGVAGGWIALGVGLGVGAVFIAGYFIARRQRLQGLRKQDEIVIRLDRWVKQSSLETDDLIRRQMGREFSNSLTDVKEAKLAAHRQERRTVADALSDLENRMDLMRTEVEAAPAASTIVSAKGFPTRRISRMITFEEEMLRQARNLSIRSQTARESLSDDDVAALRTGLEHFQRTFSKRLGLLEGFKESYDGPRKSLQSRKGDAMAATITNNRWVREPDDFAIELRERDLSGLFSQRIVIEEGTAGLLMVDGRFDRRLDPGEHVLEGGVGAVLGGWDRKRIVLVTLGEVMLYITLPRLLTRDPVPFGVQTAVTLRFTSGREAIFLSNFMSGKDSLGTSELRRLVYPEINEAAQDWASKHSVRQLAEDLSLRDDLALALESHIRPLLDRYGLTFGRMEVREFKCEIWDKSLNQRVETSLQVTQEQAELEGRKRLFDLAVETDIQDLAEETEKAATYEKRIKLDLFVKTPRQPGARWG